MVGGIDVIEEVGFVVDDCKRMIGVSYVVVIVFGFVKLGEGYFEGGGRSCDGDCCCGFDVCYDDLFGCDGCCYDVGYVYCWLIGR